MDGFLTRRPQASSPMITSAQIRAARGLLNWSAAQLGSRAGMSWSTVQRAESGDGTPRVHAETLDRIQRALEAASIEFIAEDRGGGPGVRLRRGEPQER
jgi:transcriptional regulator with XRE-family HTH domain